MKHLPRIKTGLPLGKLTYIMAVFTVLLSVLLLFSTRRTSEGYEAMRQNTENYVKWQQSANDLLSAANYLTEQARGFITTGSSSRLDAYVEELTVTCRRERAAEVLREELNGTDACLRATAAYKQTESLKELELYAMRLAAEGFGLAPDTLPQLLRKVVLTPEDATLPRGAQQEQARNMVFDRYYVGKHDSIAENMQLCFDDLVRQTERKQADAASEMEVLLRTEQILVILLIVLVLTIVLLTSLLVIAPLLKSTLRLQDEKPLPIAGSDEFRTLARSYNAMFDALRGKKEQLDYAGAHDKLTGLYNRTGYDLLLQRTPADDCALLLIDVDRFRSVNEIYGSDMSDRLLMHIAAVLRENFRSEDYICRIGGDVFAVIMQHVDAQAEELIRGKVDAMNERLRSSTDGLPLTSLSVGVAFGREGLDAGDVEHNADLALGSVKKGGRCGCAFHK